MNLYQTIDVCKPHKLGFFHKTKTEKSHIYSVAVVLYPQESAGVRLRLKNKNVVTEHDLFFGEDEQFGNIYSCDIEIHTPYELCGYCFLQDGEMIRDPKANAYERDENGLVWAKVIDDRYKWTIRALKPVAYEDSIIYSGHVRGLTMDKSVKCKKRGTFAGIIERIPYFKELGITALELLPIYELAGTAKKSQVTTMQEAIERKFELPSEAPKKNYWGFGLGLYYAPRKELAYNENAVVECKDMVNALHENGLEMIMQIYFPDEVMSDDILSILHYWVDEFHVDGFHLQGTNFPLETIINDGRLSHTKLLYYGFPIDKKQEYKGLLYKNLANCTDEYMNDVRRFVKSDDNMIPALLHQMKKNPLKTGSVNYISYYDSMTLMDMVSYDYKHNDANGENNSDGRSENLSWNCGIEGETRKKNILKLRKKQMKNALGILLLSGGTPLLLAGDEYGNSQNGNNNPYCQDNELGWTQYKRNAYNQELFEYTKALIAFRKAHPILHPSSELVLKDIKNCGYPQLSYHGSEAWKPDMSNNSRCIGMLFCDAKSGEDPTDMIYALFNSHWEEHSFAFPTLEPGYKWELAFSSSEDVPMLSEDCLSVTIEERSSAVYIRVLDETVPIVKKEKYADRTAF